VLSQIRDSPEARARAQQGQQPAGGGVGSTGMAMTPDRQALMTSLRQGTPNRDALLRMRG